MDTFALGYEDRAWLPMPALTVSKSAPPSEAAVRHEASRMAGRVTTFVGHALIWALCCLLVFVTAGFFPALVVGLSWGIGLACHGYFAVVAPELKRHWVEGELARRLGPTIADERRQLEGRHARSLEELSASIAHEIRNPITAAKSLVQQVSEDPSSSDSPEYLKIALEELDRVERSVSHLLRYAREEEPQAEDVRLSEVIDAALRTLEARTSNSRVRVEQRVDSAVRISGDPEQLRRVVLNLVQNALDALEATDAAAPLVRVACGHNFAQTEAWLSVTDNGPGIEPERLAKIWNPFHTSKTEGTGLGLAITKKLVEGHAGRIEVKSDAKGTEFVATFPTSAPGQRPTTSQRAPN